MHNCKKKSRGTKKVFDVLNGIYYEQCTRHVYCAFYCSLILAFFFDYSIIFKFPDGFTLFHIFIQQPNNFYYIVTNRYTSNFS